MRYIFILTVLISIYATPALSNGGHKVFCTNSISPNNKNIPKGKFECGIEYKTGAIQLLPKYKRIVKNILLRRDKILFITRSYALLQTSIFTSLTSMESGAAYFKQDGSGYRALFFDNGADYFKNGLARYVAKNKIGFINKQGNIVIPAQYDFVTPFSDGYARYCDGCRKQKSGEFTKIIGGRWHTIDKKGNNVGKRELAPITIKAISQLDNLGHKSKQFANDIKVRQLYKSQCDAGNSIACTGYGKLLSELIVSGWALSSREFEFAGINTSRSFEFDNTDSRKQTYIKTMAFLSKQCNTKKNQQLCGVLSFHKYNNFDKRQAFKLLGRACKSNIGWACSNLGYLKDLDFKHDIAIQYYNQACKLNNQTGCNNATSKPTKP